MPGKKEKKKTNFKSSIIPEAFQVPNGSIEKKKTKKKKTKKPRKMSQYRKKKKKLVPVKVIRKYLYLGL